MDSLNTSPKSYLSAEQEVDDDVVDSVTELLVVEISLVVWEPVVTEEDVVVPSEVDDVPGSFPEHASTSFKVSFRMFG